MRGEAPPWAHSSPHSTRPPGHRRLGKDSMSLVRLAVWLTACVQPVFSAWPVRAGGASADEGHSMISDGAGGAFVTGFMNGDGTYGSTLLTRASGAVKDAFVMHVTSAGVIDWAIQAGDSDQARGNAITTDGAGGVLVTGYFKGVATFQGKATLTSAGRQDVFVMRVTGTGTVLWAIKVGAAMGDIGDGIVSDGVGGAYVSGSFTWTVSFGATELSSSSSGAFLMHVTGQGAITWAAKIGDSIAETSAIMRAPDGKHLMAGSCVQQCTIGTTTLDPSPNLIWVARVGTDGTVEWVTNFQATTAMQLGDATTDGLGGVTVTGSFEGDANFGSPQLSTASTGSHDIFVAHVNANGAIQWALQAGGGGLDIGWDIVPCMIGGGTLVTGSFKGAATFGSFSLSAAGGNSAGEVFVARVTSAGGIAWAVSDGGTSSPYVTTATSLLPVGACESALVTGYFRSLATFGSTSLTAAGSSDIFVAHITGPTPPPPPPKPPSPPPLPSPQPSPLPPGPCQDREELLQGNTCQTVVWWAASATVMACGYTTAASRVAAALPLRSRTPSHQTSHHHPPTLRPRVPRRQTTLVGIVRTSLTAPARVFLSCRCANVPGTCTTVVRRAAAAPVPRPRLRVGTVAVAVVQRAARHPLHLGANLKAATATARATARATTTRLRRPTAAATSRRRRRRPIRQAVAKTARSCSRLLSTKPARTSWWGLPATVRTLRRISSTAANRAAAAAFNLQTTSAAATYGPGQTKPRLSPTADRRCGSTSTAVPKCALRKEALSPSATLPPPPLPLVIPRTSRTPISPGSSQT